MHSNKINRMEVKVPIGCRVTQEQKEILLKQAQEKGFNSFSQFLEDLILKASTNDELKENQNDEVLERLSDVDLDNIEVRVSKLLSKPKEPLETPLSNPNDLQDWLLRFCNVMGYYDGEDLETTLAFLKTDFTLDEFLEQTPLKVIVLQDLESEQNFINNNSFQIEMKPEQKELLNSLLDFLLENGYGVSKSSILFALPIPFLKDGEGVFSDKKYTEMFLNKFIEINNQNVKDYGTE